MALENEVAQPTVREILEEQVSAHAEALAAPAVETPAPIAAETETQKADRIRDEAGRFTKNSTVAEPVKTAPIQDATIAQAAVEPITAIPRPSSWKKEMWPLWDKLNTGAPLTAQEARQVAEYNAQREQQFASGVSTYKQEAERAKPIMEALAPFEQELQRINTSAPQMVHQLMSAHNTLANGSASEKLNLLGQLAQNYGIPLNAFFDQAAQQQYLNTAPARQQPAPQPAPDINSLVEQALTQREVKQTIGSMEKDTTKYPFFQYVRGTMAQLLEQGVTTDLDEAYQTALSAPEHSRLSVIQQQQQDQAEQQRRLEATRTTAKVARANVVSTKSATPMGVSATNSKPSVREALQASMDAVAGSARV